MKGLGTVTRFAIAVFGLVLVRLLMKTGAFSGEPTGSTTTGAFAEALLIDWSLSLVIVGAMLAMAMIGASYLVRDERLENLVFDLGGEEE